MRLSIGVAALTIFISSTGQAQTLVSAQKNGSLTAGQLQQRIQTYFGANSLPAAARDVDFYKVRYRSRDERQRPVTLTGLVVLPRNAAPKGLVVYNHGTTADRATSPSRYQGQAGGSETELPLLAFASGGYAVALPDYLGMGEHQGTHPYPLGQINARAAIDIILPARAVARQQRVNVGPKLFITGYSEGGAVAMWTTRLLEREKNPDYRVALAAPLSGPYDLSGLTRRSLLTPAKSGAEFALRLYLLSNITYYQHKNSGRRLTEFYKPVMANAVARAFGGSFSDEDIIKRLYFAAAFMRANNQLEKVLAPKFLQALRNNDSREPLIRALKQNDTYSWSPRTRLLLVALATDTVVTPQNTTKTLRTMRARGIGANTVRQYIIRDAKANHVTVMPQALVVARRFFDGGFGAVPGAR